MAADVSRIGILGLTSWGLGLALVLARAGREVSLIARNAEEASHFSASQSHPRLHGAALPEPVLVLPPVCLVTAAPPVLILAVPAQRMRENLRQIAPLLASGTILVSAAKGIEQATGLRMTEVLAGELGARYPYAVLSGPNLAPELVMGQPAAAVLACPDPAVATGLQAQLATPQLRLYTSSDVIGVELGGALKNVIALAVGLSDGLGYGDNAKAALITRGLAEMVRLGVALGADPLTFAGLSGLGDLIATCASPLSRNARAGRLLASGVSPSEVQTKIGEVVEGIGSAAAARNLAVQLGVEMPVTEQLCRVLYDGLSPSAAAEALLLRDLTAEPPL